MNIAIIGAGAVGTALGGVWARNGHHVLYGLRQITEGRIEALVAAHPGGRAVSPVEAVADADVVLLATPWESSQAALAAIEDWTGRILIDATNPLRSDFSDLEAGYSVSAGERVADWARGARVYKAFNTTAAANMADAGRFKDRPVMFVAGDDPDGKQVVTDLVTETGFEAIDAGPLASARLLEPLAMLFVRVSGITPMGRDYALGVLRPTTPD